MILNIFILILAIEIIAKRPPEIPPDGGPIIKYQTCQPAKRLWCLRPKDPKPKNPKLFAGPNRPFHPIPPVKCGVGDPIIPPVRCTFRPEPPVECEGPIPLVIRGKRKWDPPIPQVKSQVIGPCFPGRPKDPKPKGGKRIRWLPCSLDSSVVR